MRPRIDKLDLAREGASHEKNMDFGYRGDGGVCFDSIGRGGFARSGAIIFFRAALFGAALLGAALLGVGPPICGSKQELFE